MSHWERLLLSSLSGGEPVNSWPPGFGDVARPLASPRNTQNKNRSLISSTSSSVASTASTGRKRRPSVLGGGFSTVGSCAASSPKSIQGSWIEDDTDPKARPCWQQRHADRVGHPATRRGSRSDGHEDDDDDDDDRDEEEEEDHDKKTESTEIAVVGWGDRSRRRNSSRRASREETAEWNDGRPRKLSSKGVVLATATSTANSQQRQHQQYDGTANETHQMEAGRRNTDKTFGGAATSIGTAIAYVGGSDDGSGVSISAERATEIVTIPAVTPPPFHGGQQAAATAAAATSIPSVAQPPPTRETPRIGTLKVFYQSPASQSAGEGASAKSATMPTRMGLAASAPNLPNLGSMNNESDQHSSGSGSRFPQVLPWQRWRQEGRGASVGNRAGLAVAAGGGLEGCGVLLDGGGQKVFHNFVFRRKKRRKDRKPLRDTLASLDDNATDYQAASSAGGTSGRRAAGWRCGGHSSSSCSGSSVEMRDSWLRRRQKWETHPSGDWDRPERPGQMNRTRPPLRTPRDAFSVVSFSSSGSTRSPCSSPPANGQRAGGDPCSSGVGRRPVKCQRCGSSRVKLLATTVASARRSPTHLLRQPPRRASIDSFCVRARHMRENAGGGGGSRNSGVPTYSDATSGSSRSSIDRLRLAPVSNRHKQQGNTHLVRSMLSPRRKNVAGLGDTGRIGTGGESLAELRGGERNAANLPRGFMDGAAVVGSRKASVRPPPGGGIIIPAPKPHLMTPVSRGGSGL
ncbi:unnamed protein product [Ectocarpus sp. 13 AM-2016]